MYRIRLKVGKILVIDVILITLIHIINKNLRKRVN